jgi:hypothetical protein
MALPDIPDIKTGKFPPMPPAYKTPKGRVVRANPALHRMVCLKKTPYGGYVACAFDGGEPDVEDSEGLVQRAAPGTDTTEAPSAKKRGRQTKSEESPSPID